MPLGRLTPPQSPWEGLQFANFDQCLHILMVIGKSRDVSRGIFWLGGGGGEKKGVMWWKFSMEEFFMGEEYFHKGGAAFSSII